MKGRAHRIKSSEDPIPIEMPWWYAECSGSYYEDFKHFLSHTTGEAKLLLVWEGGDSVGGLIVKNGVVKEGKVSYVIEDAD